jgi:hypothetical protein
MKICVFIMKNCEFCEHTMKPSNFKKHQERCFYKIQIKATKKEVEAALQRNPPEQQRSDQFDIAFLELKKFLTEIFTRSRVLYKRVVENDLRDPIERIKEIHVGEGTKYGYLVEYNRYKKWLNKNKKSIDSDSVNMYLSTLKCKSSTLKKKQAILQNILRLLVDSNIKLNPIRINIAYQPKYSLSNEEVTKYLEEQNADPELYLIQKLMIRYGLRVNTAAGLKKKHLYFLEGETNEIMLPDTKVRSIRVERVDEDLEIDFRKFLEDTELEDEDYVFYKTEKKQTIRKRALGLCKLINEKIKTSKVLKKNPNYKYSSHMFRKTKANEVFQEGLKQLKENSRKAIGQKSNSSAIEHYIN